MGTICTVPPPTVAHHPRAGYIRLVQDRSVRLHLPSTVKSQLGRKHHQMTIAQWNVRTLLDRGTTNRPERRTALVTMELAKYNIDIAVLSETRFRFHASGNLNDLEYTFYWCGKSNADRREAGIGFAIKKDIVAKLTEMPHPVSDRIMTMKMPLTKDRNATIVSAYTPTMANPGENKKTFYCQLKGILRNIPSTDKLLLIGDFNARIGRENDKWPSALGKYGIGNVIPTASFYWHYELSSI